MAKQSKRYRAALKLVEEDRKYELADAVKLLKSFPATKFDQTVELSVKLGIDPKNAEQAIRGSVSLPKGIGKTLRVVAFCQGDNVEKAKAAGAIEVGADELIAKVNGGWLDFDVAVATPDMMPKVGRLGRVLGPKGLMPSPKAGTVVPDIATAVKEFAGGKIEYRNDDGGNIHAAVGKVSFPEGDLIENVNALVARIRSQRPASAKGEFIQKVVLTCSMGPGIELNIAG
jgi:large subunit ribosomal protein L1